jgi:hypothetical protein
MNKSKTKKTPKISISVCVGTGGVAAGGYEVINAFRLKLKEKGLTGKIGKRCEINEKFWIGVRSTHYTNLIYR